MEARRVKTHRSNLIIVDGSRPARASLVKQAITAILQKSATPLANGVFVEAEFGSYRLAWQAIRTSQVLTRAILPLLSNGSSSL